MTDLTWGIGDSEIDATHDALVDLGAQWVRLEFRWYEGEPSAGRYDDRVLRKWDRAVEVSRAAGANIVALVHRAPRWASGANDTYSAPQDPADYAAFMRFLAARYRGQVAGWEIWNEPNSSRFWPAGPDAAEYVSLLRAAYPAVKAADPSARVVFGGTAYSDYPYISRAYAAGAKGFFDVMATHPYSDQWSPDRVWYSGSHIAVQSFTAYREVRRVMLANDDPKPIWLTEFGWSTTTTSVKGVTAAQQASYLTRASCLIDEDPYVGVALWYNLRNNYWDRDADTWEAQLGLLTTKFEPKPAYDAFKRYTPSSCAVAAATPPPDPAPVPTEPEASPASAQPAHRRSPRLAVRRARLRSGRLVVHARVARRATGTVRGVVSYDGRRRRFKTAPKHDGRIRVQRKLRGIGATARLALVYRRDAGFRRQRVVLQAARRNGRLRLKPAAAPSGDSASRIVRGTVNPDARGSVVLHLASVGADGKMTRSTGRARIRRGRFRHSVRLRPDARASVVHVVFPGDPDRNISGGSAVVEL